MFAYEIGILINQNEATYLYPGAELNGYTSGQKSYIAF